MFFFFYYYDFRFVYKFVCDLTQLIGYNAQELANLVNTADPNLNNMMMAKNFLTDSM